MRGLWRGIMVCGMGLCRLRMLWQNRLCVRLGWVIPLYGAVDITAQVSGAGVSGTASMDEGRIVKWNFLQRLLRPMAQWGLINADEVPLKDVTVVFQVQGDEVILDGTQFTASDIACVLNGKSTRDQLDYVLDVEMPIQFAGFRLGRAIPIRIKITGPANAPEVADGDKISFKTTEG